MTSVGEILTALRAEVGARGCLVMMHDGIAAAHSVEDCLQPDQVAGLTSFLTSTLKRVLAEAGMGAFTTLTTHSAYGSVLVQDLGESYLVLVLDDRHPVPITSPDIQSAARDLRRVLQISL